jgi:oligoendopeptidase F
MMTFTGSLAGLRTLTSLVSSKVRFTGIPSGNWPDTRDDPPSYGNGMLYVAEMMLDDYLISQATSKEEKVFHLNNALYRLWRHNFSLVIEAELDASIQKMFVENEPPSGRKISETYMQILKSYYGDIEVNPVFRNEWMVNSVTFLSYEGHFWPVAMAAATLTYEKLRMGDERIQQVMSEGLLGKCETDLSYDMFKSMGIDLANASTYQAMYTRMENLLNEMEKLVN